MLESQVVCTEKESAASAYLGNPILAAVALVICTREDLRP